MDMKLKELKDLNEWIKGMDVGSMEENREQFVNELEIIHAPLDEDLQHLDDPEAVDNIVTTLEEMMLSLKRNHIFDERQVNVLKGALDEIVKSIEVGYQMDWMDWYGNFIRNGLAYTSDGYRLEELILERESEKEVEIEGLKSRVYRFDNPLDTVNRTATKEKGIKRREELTEFLEERGYKVDADDWHGSPALIFWDPEDEEGEDYVVWFTAFGDGGVIAGDKLDEIRVVEDGDW